MAVILYPVAWWWPARGDRSVWVRKGEGRQSSDAQERMLSEAWITLIGDHLPCHVFPTTRLRRLSPLQPRGSC